MTKCIFPLKMWLCHIFNPFTHWTLELFPFVYVSVVYVCAHVCTAVCLCVCMHVEAGDQHQVLSFIVLSLIFSNALRYFTCVCMCMYTCMCVYRYTLKSEEGWQISWSWSYRWFCELMWVLGSRLWSSDRSELLSSLPGLVCDRRLSLELEFTRDWSLPLSIPPSSCELWGMDRHSHA